MVCEKLKLLRDVMAIILSGNTKTIVNGPSNMDVHFSSKNSEWQTPLKLYDALNERFEFTLDVACNRENCLAPFGFFVEEGNSLEYNWYDLCVHINETMTCFMNPPYGRQIAKWVKKAYEEGKKGVTIVCLLPARTDTRWFQDYCSKGEIWFIKGRVKFFNPDEPDNLTPAPFPSCIVVFGPLAQQYVGFWAPDKSILT